MRRIAVVGAGFGGLAASIRLASSGYDVDLFEKQDFVGGKAASLRLGGYRFDTGPSLLTMVPVFRELFEYAGTDFDRRVKIVPLEPLCTYFFPDGAVLHSSSDPERFAENIRGMTGASGSRADLRGFLTHGRKIYDTAAWLFLHNSLHDPGTYADRRAWSALLNLRKIDAFRSLDRANRSFFSDPRLVQLFNRYATYNGSSPYRVPATFNIIPYIEYGTGGFAVEGGIFAISKALGSLARETGVKIHLGTQVERIEVRDGRVRGIAVGGKSLAYDAVVSNADVVHTYDRLLHGGPYPWRRRYSRLEPSSSALVFYWAMSRSFPKLGVHNIFFSGDYKQEFSEIFDGKKIPEEPTVYINITSKVTPEDAPAGGENWFVLLNVPFDNGQNWQGDIPAVRSRVLRILESRLGGGIGGHIAAEEVMTPKDIEKNTNSAYGSLYGVSSNGVFAAFKRHPNRLRSPRGLYFCGGSSHPGGGMPLAVLSGKIAARLVRKYEPN
jgi:diapolycopene oxygenase